MKSNREYKLELSQEAYDDLINIQNYTYSEYGERQWKKYESLLDKAMNRILHGIHVIIIQKIAFSSSKRNKWDGF